MHGFAVIGQRNLIMETKAKITGFAVDHLDNKIRLEIEMSNADYADSVETMQKGEIRLSMKPWREGRSLNANAYFYVLVDKIADSLKVSKSYIHNLMLRRYGKIQRIDGKPIWIVLPESEEVLRKVDEDDSLHLKPTSELKEGRDNNFYRTYLLLKGSHELDSKEMSVLITGTADEAKQLGIQTATPQDLKEMAERWGI